MRNKNNGCCRRIQGAIKMLIRHDGPKIDRMLFGGSLPTPTPRDPRDIFDLILQLILLLLEEWKPDEDEDDNNGETHFPNLAKKAAQLAEELVPADILSLSAQQIAEGIEKTVETFRRHAPENLRLAREGVRIATHGAVGSMARKWNLWNDTIRGILDAYANRSMLTSLPRYLDAWTQIAKGLRQIE